MRSIRSRLRTLELALKPQREPRIVTLLERLDGGFDRRESRPEEEGDETIQITLVYEDPPLPRPPLERRAAGLPLE
jgi:hypothetical protein